MRIKSQYIDLFISDPFTSKMVNTTLLDPQLYQYYYNKGYDWLFETDDEIKLKNDDYKSEIEIDLFNDEINLN